MFITRRSLFSIFGAGLLPPALRAETQPAPVLTSTGLPYEQLPVTATPAGQSRAVLKGKLPTGEELEIHHTTLNPGSAPHVGHKHASSEILLVREGTVEFTANGKSVRLGPGSVGLASSNDSHAAKNVGKTQANYFVVAVGPGAFR